ncbi:MAG: hypothetical protein ACRETX_16025, partial [Steroidobacteraceae bacterium]
MTSFKPVAALMALACIGLPAVGEAADDATALRAELEALQADYAKRIAALEGRITQLEAGAELAATMPAQAAPPAQPQAGSRSAASAFNPAISL